MVRSTAAGRRSNSSPEPFRRIRSVEALRSDQAISSHQGSCEPPTNAVGMKKAAVTPNSFSTGKASAWLSA